MIIPKFLNSGKTPIRQLIEENKRKLKFLNLNGIKIKIDGSWGPWLLKLYNRIKSTNKNNFLSYILDIFNNIMIGAAVADNPSVMTASGWNLNKNGKYTQKRTKESDLLASNLETIGTAAITAPTLAQDIAGIYNIVRHPVLTGKTIYTTGKDIYNYGRDLIWLAKSYNNVGTGLKNPYVRKKFLDVAKSPSTSRHFIETYSRDNDAGLTYSLIKEAIPLLEKILEDFGIIPLMQFRSYEPVNLLIGNLRNALLSVKNLNNRYIKELEILKNNNKILYDIAKESPLYLLQIVNDLKNGNITNIEEYVKDLIKLSNTFLRRMDLKSGQDFTDAFSKIRGRSMGHEDFSMDVGNPEVVFDPIWSRGYGNDIALYSPKEIKLNGPVETWWSQRRPVFQDKSIHIDAEGMHTGSQVRFDSSDNMYNVNKYIKSVDLPSSYGRDASHMVFLSPNEGASIADLFIITPGYQKNIRYTLGYKNGGELQK